MHATPRNTTAARNAASAAATLARMGITPGAPRPLPPTGAPRPAPIDTDDTAEGAAASARHWAGADAIAVLRADQCNPGDIVRGGPGSPVWTVDDIRPSSYTTAAGARCIYHGERGRDQVRTLDAAEVLHLIYRPGPGEWETTTAADRAQAYAELATAPGTTRARSQWAGDALAAYRTAERAAARAIPASAAAALVRAGRAAATAAAAAGHGYTTTAAALAARYGTTTA